jgi:hypothetical protein
MFVRLSDGAKLGLAALVAVGLGLVLAAANFWFGNLNQDEGWYLYAALESARGRLPYRDFFFTQGPVMPLLYGWLAPLWSPWGVAGGRLLSGVLGLGGGVLTALLAARLLPAGRKVAGATVAWVLIAGCTYHSYFTTLPKTYALAAVLLMGGYLALTATQRAPRGLPMAAGVLLALAAGTRLSLGMALAVTGLWLLGNRRHLGRAWFWFGVGGVLGLAAVYAPYLALAPDQFRFANSFHTGRDTGGGLLFVAGSVSRCVRGYLPLALLTSVLAVAWMDGRRRLVVAAADASAPAWPTLWVLSFVAIFSVHLVSPYPYDDYQVPVMPLLAAATGVWLFRLPGVAAVRPATVVWSVVLAAGLAAFASPINQEWFVIRQDRFWVVTKPQSDLALLRRVGRWIREATPPDKPLLTQDVYLAVEAGRRVPAGFEMGPFGYFPKLDDAQADTCHVLNRAGLERALATTDAPVAAFSGYALSIGAPSMRELPATEQHALWQVVARRYDRLECVPDFGQDHTALTLWRLRASEVR